MDGVVRLLTCACCGDGAPSTEAPKEEISVAFQETIGATCLLDQGPELKKEPVKCDTKRPCRLRIIAVNDVYELTHLARLRTLIQKHSEGLPASNVVTTLAGDFIAPSILSSLDHGVGMIKVLNAVPVNMVCFGNHETDIPYPKLQDRISEYKGVWLNSNIPDLSVNLPKQAYLNLVGDDGMPDARCVAFLGGCIGGGKFGATYREDAFGGAAETMIPVVEALTALGKEIKNGGRADEVIPITHQDMPQDRELAQTGLFPVVVAGHDHEEMLEYHGPRNAPIVKAGQDAVKAAVIDVVWSSIDSTAPPTVTVEMVKCADFEPDVGLQAEISVIEKPVRELETACIYEIPEGATLTSIGIKFGESSMARLVATAIRNCLECDAAIVNSGAVRGKKEYKEGVLTYGDLKKECPYPSMMVVTKMPFEILRDAIKESRRPWWDLKEGEERQEGNSAFHADEDCKIGENHMLFQICGGEPEEGRLYHVACDTRYLKKNPVFKKYAEEHPERIQPEDAGRPVLPILVEYFCGEMWMRLINTGKNYRQSVVNNFFTIADADGDGNIDVDELQKAVSERMGKRLSSGIIMEQMIAAVDENFDGKVNADELNKGIQKILTGGGLP
eukprot:TRINITY_DN9329_c0_g1_i1.p1 TRINITY_DN9329_c0_g1~~TRINITY_DN9329_c0_g1_i1.p1  ORF type:complete len:616 (-),score=148.50 TRINITY_DN9329_c0_g1_i1:259-2106(-)